MVCNKLHGQPTWSLFWCAGLYLVPQEARTIITGRIKCSVSKQASALNFPGEDNLKYHRRMTHCEFYWCCWGQLIIFTHKELNVYAQCLCSTHTSTQSLPSLMCIPSSVQQGPVNELASAIRRLSAWSMPASPRQVRGSQLAHVMHKKKCAIQRTLPTETARGQWSNGDKRGRRRDGERKRDACCCHLPPWTLPTNLRPKPHLTNEYRDAEHRHGPSATTLTMHIHHSIESKGNGVCVRERGRKKRKHYKMKKEKKIVQ